MYIKVATFAVLLLVPAARLEAVFVCIAVIGVAHGCGTVIPLSIQADLVDVDELATGERKEGTYFAAWNLTGKAALALALTLSGLALDASGFRPNVAQRDLVLITIRLLLAGAPCLLLLAATRVLRRLEHSEATHERVRAALDARASAVPGPGGRAAVGILE